MKFAVIVFPGSNCDVDMYHAIKGCAWGRSGVCLASYRQSRSVMMGFSFQEDSLMETIYALEQLHDFRM